MEPVASDDSPKSEIRLHLARKLIKQLIADRIDGKSLSSTKNYIIPSKFYLFKPQIQSFGTTNISYESTSMKKSPRPTSLLQEHQFISAEKDISDSIGILGLGSVAVDDLIFATYAPPNVKTPVKHRERHFGGQAATALFAAARLGIQCTYAGVLGTDELSQAAINNMRSAGINLDYVRQDEKSHAVYALIIVDEAQRTRNIYYHSSPFAGAAIDWPPEEVLRACKVLLVDQHGIPGMTRAASIARSNGIPVVSDLETAPPGSETLFSLINHLILPDSFALSYNGMSLPSDAIKSLWTADRAAVVITCGENGCWYFDSHMPEPGHLPAFSVPVIDTTGCGDVFHDVYAVGLLEGRDLRTRVIMASAAAALKATKRGGQAGCPTRQELETFLMNR